MSDSTPPVRLSPLIAMSVVLFLIAVVIVAPFVAIGALARLGSPPTTQLKGNGMSTAGSVEKDRLKMGPEIRTRSSGPGWLNPDDPLAGLASPDATTRRFALDQTRISNWIHGYYRSGTATAEQKAALTTRLRQAFKDDSPDVRLAAAELIERTGGDLGLKPDEAVPVCEALIAESSTGPTPYVTALAAIGPDSLPALTDLIRSKNPGVRNDAANGIGRLGPEVRSKATPVLRAVIEQEKVEWVKAAALNALGKVNPDAAKQLGWYER